MAIAVLLGLVAPLAACSADPGDIDDLPSATDSPLPDETIQQLQDAVANAMTATGSSGAIVGVWAPWSGSWVAGVGTQKPGGQASVSDDMTFPAGKMTRAMTCDVLYALDAEGTVSLDDVVTQYVPGVADLRDVTLGQLCDGTSSIGSYAGQLWPTWLSNPTRTWDPRYLASFGLGQPRTTQPGEAYRDSDAGYLLLGLALERATRRSAADLITQYVAEPLELDDTRLGAATGTALTGLNSMPIEGGLNCAEPLDLTDASMTIGFTDAGVTTDIRELGRYVQALAAGTLLPEGVDRFDDPKPAYANAPSWYTVDGGAFQIASLVGQWGAVPGYVTAAFADASSGLTVAVVLNNSAAGGSVGAFLAWELAAIASKAPASGGGAIPQAGLPFTAEQYHENIAAAAITCAEPPVE